MKLKTKIDYGYALIDNGSFSGKFPFVYSICKGNTLSKMSEELVKLDSLILISLTEEEYNWIKSIDNDIEVLYNEYGMTIETKFIRG
jgi:hypothetical protein